MEQGVVLQYDKYAASSIIPIVTMAANNPNASCLDI